MVSANFWWCLENGKRYWNETKRGYLTNFQRQECVLPKTTMAPKAPILERMSQSSFWGRLANGKGYWNEIKRRCLWDLQKHHCCQVCQFFQRRQWCHGCHGHHFGEISQTVRDTRACVAFRLWVGHVETGRSVVCAFGQAIRFFLGPYAKKLCVPQRHPPILYVYQISELCDKFQVLALCGGVMWVFWCVRVCQILSFELSAYFDLQNS